MTDQNTFNPSDLAQHLEGVYGDALKARRASQILERIAQGLEAEADDMVKKSLGHLNQERRAHFAGTVFECMQADVEARSDDEIIPADYQDLQGYAENASGKRKTKTRQTRRNTRRQSGKSNKRDHASDTTSDAQDNQESPAEVRGHDQGDEAPTETVNATHRTSPDDVQGAANSADQPPRSEPGSQDTDQAAQEVDTAAEGAVSEGAASSTVKDTAANAAETRRADDEDAAEASNAAADPSPSGASEAADDDDQRDEHPASTHDAAPQTRTWYGVDYPVNEEAAAAEIVQQALDAATDPASAPVNPYRDCRGAEAWKRRLYAAVVRSDKAQQASTAASATSTDQPSADTGNVETPDHTDADSSVRSNEASGTDATVSETEPETHTGDNPEQGASAESDADVPAAEDESVPHAADDASTDVDPDPGSTNSEADESTADVATSDAGEREAKTDTSQTSQPADSRDNQASDENQTDGDEQVEIPAFLDDIVSA